MGCPLPSRVHLLQVQPGVWDHSIPGVLPCHSCNRPLVDGTFMAVEQAHSGLRRYHLRCIPDRCWVALSGSQGPTLQHLQPEDEVSPSWSTLVVRGTDVRRNDTNTAADMAHVRLVV